MYIGAGSALSEVLDLVVDTDDGVDQITGAWVVTENRETVTDRVSTPPPTGRRRQGQSQPPGGQGLAIDVPHRFTFPPALLSEGWGPTFGDR